MTRDEQLAQNIAKGEKRIASALQTGRRAIAGTVEEFTKRTDFITNPRVRDKLYIDLAKEYGVLNSTVNDWVESEVNITAKSFYNYAKEDVPKGAVKGTFGDFSEKYVQDIIGTVNPATIPGKVAINTRLGGMLAEDISILRAAVSTTIAEGAVEGLTNPEMSARMQSKLKKSAPGFKFIDKGGRVWSADRYFGMLNQTLHTNTAREAYIDTATKEAGFDLYVIDGGVTGSSVGNPDDPCDAWAGKIVSMTGDTKGYPTYQDALDDGVWHPGCVHFVRAIMPSEIPKAKVEEKEARAEEKDLPEEPTDGK